MKRKKCLTGMLLAVMTVMAATGIAIAEEAETTQVAVAAENEDFSKTVFIPNGDHEIPAKIELPDKMDEENLVPAVVMLHGTGSVKDEVGGSYKRLAEMMAREGIASIRIDFMGSGESTASDADFDFDNAMSDAVAATEYIKSIKGIDSERIGLIGWSQGGIHAYRTAANNEGYKSLVIWTTGTSRITTTEEQRAEAEKNGYYTVEYDWREPMHVGYNWILGAEKYDVLSDVAKIQAPVLGLIGTEDSIFSVEEVETVISNCANKNSKMYVIEGGDHTFNSLTLDTRVFYEAADATIKWFQETM